MKNSYLNTSFPVIRNNEPYQGYIYTTALDRDGLIMQYSDGLTFQQYNKSNGGVFVVTTWAHIDELEEIYLNSRITKPVQITESEYFEMLEILPPSRWHNIGGGEAFHMCERITGNLVTWFVKVSGIYFRFDDMSNISDEYIINKIDKQIKEA